MLALGHYLRTVAPLRFDWGTHDCCTFGCDWVLLHGHDDPMAFLRGRYRTMRGAFRLLRKHGGLLEAARYGMIDAGVPEADEPQLGDFGIIERPTHDGLDQVVALFGGERWVSLGVRGLDSGPAVALGIWRP